MISRRRLVSSGCLLGLLVVSSMASDVKSRKVRCQGIEQPYLYYSPEGAAKGAAQNAMPMPAVLLLHGAGDRAVNMIEAWKQLAASQKIILLAPELPREEKYEAAAPQVFRCLVEDARHLLGTQSSAIETGTGTAAKIDPQRVYVFGNSMGGYLAYDAGMFDSQYFAAVAVHAMRIADDYAWIVKRAQRKTPIAIYIGDHDQFFSLDSVRKTRDLLRQEGFSVHYVEMKRHDHNYYARSTEVNADAWKFLQDKVLPLPQK